MPQTESLQNAFERFSNSAREVQERWFASLQVAANGPWRQQAEETYLTQIDSAQSWVEQSIKLQSKFLQDCRRLLAGAPARQATAVTGDWFDWAEQGGIRRAELWRNWFQAARKIDFSAADELIDDARNGRGPMVSMAKLSQRALERQAEWVRLLIAPAAPEAAQDGVAEPESVADAEFIQARASAKTRSATARVTPRAAEA